MKAYRYPLSKGLNLTLLAAAALVAQQADASVSYSTVGANYLQNFDSLPNTPANTSLGSSPIGWVDDTAAPGAGNFSIVGWYLYHPITQAEGGFNGHQRVRIGAGTVNTGAFMSFGAAASTDRALGDVGSNTLSDPAGPGIPDIYIGLRLNNNTGVALDSFTLNYSGEQWRDGGAAVPNAQTMSFTWSTTATAITDPNTSFNAATALDFTSPVFANTGSGAGVDGNVAGKVVISAVTISGINWQPGTDLWLRWDDINNAGNDHGLAIDDLTFSANIAVPEPSTMALLGLGVAGLIAARKRKI